MPDLLLSFPLQPTEWTHPHLLAPGDVTAGVGDAEYRARRAGLAARLPAGAAALVAAPPRDMLPGTVIPALQSYRTSPDMMYLSGITQEGCAALVRQVEGKAHLTVFVPDADAVVDKWDGRPITQQAAAEVFGADDARPMSALPRALRQLRAEGLTFFADEGTRAALARSGARLAYDHVGRVEPLAPHLHPLRWRKSPPELALLRRAAAATCAAFEEGIAHSLREGATEATVAVTVEAGCRLRGADRMAYPSVSAVGESVNVIHYSRWDRRVTHAPGELFGLDAGCELAGMCSDITRAWPTSGTFTPATRDFYCAILEVHKECMALAVEGQTLDSMQQRAIELLERALRRLGVRGDVRQYFPHNVGHYLGMDVHDCKMVANSTPMQSRVALTCEPALYLPADAHEVPKELRGVGMRIEDMLVVSEDGAPPEVLSSALPIEADDVEALLARLR